MGALLPPPPAFQNERQRPPRCMWIKYREHSRVSKHMLFFTGFLKGRHIQKVSNICSEIIVFAIYVQLILETFGYVSFWNTLGYAWIRMVILLDTFAHVGYSFWIRILFGYVWKLLDTFGNVVKSSPTFWIRLDIYGYAPTMLSKTDLVSFFVKLSNENMLALLRLQFSNRFRSNMSSLAIFRRRYTSILVY